jgi:glutathione S-transferase
MRTGGRTRDTSRARNTHERNAAAGSLAGKKEKIMHCTDPDRGSLIAGLAPGATIDGNANSVGARSLNATTQQADASGAGDAVRATRAPVLWGVGTSRTLRPHWAFHELDLNFECRAIKPRSSEIKSDAFTALTARQKIPLLQDGDKVLTESAAIVWYLSETYGDDRNRLIPSDPWERARCLEWCFFILGELDETSLYVMRRHGDMHEIYGEAPAAVSAAAEYFRKQMRTVEQALEAGTPYILGEQFTAADILLSTCITWAIDYGIPVTDAVLAYNARATARPAYAQAQRTNGPLPPRANGAECQVAGRG